MSLTDVLALRFLVPELLGLILIVPLLWWLRSRPGSSRSPLRSLGSGLFRSLAVLGVVLAMAQPVREFEEPDRARVLVIDQSASMTPERRARLARELEELAEEADDVTLRFVHFGDRLQSLDTLQASLAVLAGAGEPSRGSDLRSGLELALAVLPAAADRRLVLLSDGGSTSAELSAVLELAEARAVPIDVRLIAERRAVARVLSIAPPQDRTLGEVLRVPVEVALDQAATLGMFLASSDGSELRTEVEAPAGTSTLEVRWRPKSAGLHRVTVTLEAPAAGTSLELAGSAEALVRVRGRPRALLVGDEKETRRLAAGLRGLSPSLSARRRTRLPGPPYSSLRLIGLLNPDFGAMPQRHLDALIEWVRDGGRLFVSGGDKGLVTDPPRLEGIAELLPVRFPKTKKKERAPLAVVYCLDRSDSMAGSAKFELAAAALAQSLHVLPDEARVGIVGFADFPTWVLPFGPLEGISVAIDALASVEVRGGTSIYHGLQAAYEALGPDDSMVKHVIVLSDGQSTTTFSRHGDVVDAMGRRGITVSTIAVSRDSDRAEMERIARAGGGRSYYTENFKELPRLFLDEMMIVTRTNKVEERLSVHPIAGSRLLRKMKPRSDWPQLSGYVRGYQKAGSELALATSEGQPLLASGRFGRGVVTLFTSDIGGPWTGEWEGWGGEKPFWRSVMSATLQPHPPELVRLSTRPTGAGLWVEFDAVDSLRNPRGDLEVEAIVEREGGTQDVWVLPPVGPGRYGGLLGFDGDEPRLLRVAAVGTTHPSSPAPPGGEVLASVTAPRPLEARHPAENPALLASVAADTGGQPLERLRETLDGEPGSRRASEALWPLLLRLALLCFLVDVAWRRVRLPSRVSRPRPDSPPAAA